MYRRYHGIIPSCDPQNSYTITLERDDASTSHPMRELTFYGEGFTIEREPQDTDTAHETSPLPAERGKLPVRAYSTRHPRVDSSPPARRQDDLPRTH